MITLKIEAASAALDYMGILTGDAAWIAIPMELDDDLVHHVGQYCDRVQRRPTDEPKLIVPLGLLAWYATGHDVKDWHGFETLAGED